MRGTLTLTGAALAALAALLITACDRPVVAPDRATIEASTVSPAAAQNGTATEPAAYNDRICTLRFPGTPSQTAEMFVIWNLGHGILDVPFDTPRPDLYAVLPGTMHRDPNHPELDHDHIVSHGPGAPGYDGTWDVWVVVPGPQFNPATYQAPRDVDAMFALIGRGVLAGPLSFSQAGFGRDLVLRAPLICN
jgi:hypothetical protein